MKNDNAKTEMNFEAQSMKTSAFLPASDFVKASDRESDPVGRRGDDWGFWDEMWCDWHGGHANEIEARNALAEYIRVVLDGTSTT